MVVEVAVELVHNKLLMFNEAENSSGFKMIENRLKQFKNHESILSAMVKT